MADHFFRSALILCLLLLSALATSAQVRADDSADAIEPSPASALASGSDTASQADVELVPGPGPIPHAAQTHAAVPTKKQLEPAQADGKSSANVKGLQSEPTAPQKRDTLDTSVVLATVPIVTDTLASDSIAYTRSEVSANTSENQPALLAPEDFKFAGLPRYTISGSRPFVETSVGLLPTVIVGTTVAAAAVGLHIHQANAWWADQRGPFHIQDDWDYALQADKAGHFVAGHALAYFGGEAMMESGFSHEAATWVGAAIGLGYHTYVEVEDGFGTNWGFSPTDMAANALGTSYYILQYYFPGLQNFQPKWQYIPAEWTGERPIPHATAVFDDYASSTFFLSVNMHRVLPGSIGENWPAWLNLAVGYGVRDFGYLPDIEPKGIVVVALDYNMNELLPEGPGFWNWIRQSMNFIKFPAPAIEIGPVTRFRLMYPFEFSISDFKF